VRGPARRLLIVCYFYPPLAGGGVHRVLGFTRYLPLHGWSCTVVCAGMEDYWVTDPSLLERVPPATEVVRVEGGSALSLWLRWRRQSGRRSGREFARWRALGDWWLLPDSYAGWARRARAAARRRLQAGGFDALLSSSPPDSVHMAALDLRRRFGIPWVADFRDPWVGLHLRRPVTAWHRAAQAGLERRVLEGADLILAASRTHAASLAARPDRVCAGKVEHLPNGYEPKTETPGDPASAPAHPDKFLIAYTGMLSQMPDTEVLLEALHELLARRPEARRRVRARLAGPFDSGYADRAVALGLTGIVEFSGPLPHREARALQRRADLLLLWKPRDCPSMVPGKLYEYLDAGRPLGALLGPGEEASELVRQGGGTVIDPGDRGALAALIERHYLAWKEGERQGASPPAWLASNTRERLAARLAELLERLKGERA